MVAIHPQFIRSGDRDEFVVLPHGEFLAICELLEDVLDFRLIEEARKANLNLSGISIEQMKVELGVE